MRLLAALNPFWWWDWISDVRRLGWERARHKWHDESVARRLERHPSRSQRN